MAKSKQSVLRVQYMKERRRIQNQLRRMARRGYEFTKDILPAIPKKISKQSISRLQKITTKKLYEKAEHVDYSTGEVISGQQYRQQERKESARKASRTRALKRARRKTEPEKPAEEPEPESWINDYIVAFSWLESELTQIYQRYPRAEQSLRYILDQAVSQVESGLSLDTGDQFNIQFQIEQILGKRIVNSSSEVREAVEAIDNSAYNVQGKRFTGACNALARVLLDRPATAEENRMITEAQEQDTDFSTYDD